MTFHYEPPMKVDGVVTLTMSEGAYRALFKLVGEQNIVDHIKIGTDPLDAKALEDLYINEWKEPSELE